MPSSYLARSNECFTTIYVKKTVKKIIDDIMKLSGNAKTSPATKQSVEDYLNEPQPHLKYLLKSSDIEKKVALRIWAATEGSIGIVRKSSNIRPRLEISCTHPVLAKQLQEISKQFGINFILQRSKNRWSGISALLSMSISACIEFLKIGGFIEGVKISANSPYHEGIRKDILTLGILEYKKREQKNQKFKNFPLRKVHHEINKIIKRQEYKSAGYYINYFS
jgi:hypothetical protein